MTLRLRIALILAAVGFGVGVFAGGAAYVITSSQLRSTIDDTLTSRASAVNVTSTEHGRGGGGGPGDGGDGDGGPDGHDCPLPGSFAPASAAQLVSDQGYVTSCIEGAPVLPVADGDLAIPDGSVAISTASVDGDDYRVLSTPWHGGGTLQIARSLSETDALLDRLRLELLAMVGVATLVSAALGWAVATRLVRPIERLREATHHIATTLDFSTPIEVGGPGEVGSLATSFSTMVDAVGRSQEQQRRLVSDASHEMRTPLTSLRSNVELVRQIDRLPAAEREEVVKDVLEDVDELSSLLAELVDLASDLAAAEVAEPMRLGDLARSVAARTERRTGRPVSVQDDSGVETVGRPRQVERAISNLVDNAVKYSEVGREIDITVDHATVTVRDRGRGIADGDLDRVFDRFYRAVDARTEPGSGLGLSIVDEIARSHGGTVFARNRPDGGAEVGFTLPPA